MLADYLHVLLLRVAKTGFPTFAPPGFDRVVPLNKFVAVPEAVASAGLTRYDQLRPFLASTFGALPARRVGPPHPKILSYGTSPVTLAEIQAAVEAGRPFFQDFALYWHRYVQPKVQQQIAAWRTQDSRFHPLRMLLELQRLPLHARQLQVVCMPFHPAASGNYSPAAVYSSLFEKPNLCWFLGHEASHLLWSEAVGTPLASRPGAGPILKRAESAKVDLEETMCLFMQVQLSKACGATPAAYRISADFPEGGQKKLLASLESDWEAYVGDRQRWQDLQVYVLEKASAVFA
jgi:hypothetical protein